MSPGADVRPAAGAGVSAVLAFAVGGVLAEGAAAPRLRWRLAGEGYDDTRVATGEVLGICQGVQLRFPLPEGRVDFLLLEPAALPGRYHLTGIAFRGEVVAEPHGRVISAVDEATAGTGACGVVVAGQLDRPAVELDVRGLAPDRAGGALELEVRREAGTGAVPAMATLLDDVRAGQAAIGRLGREVAALSDRVAAQSGMSSALADLQARNDAATGRLAAVLAAQDQALAALAGGLATQDRALAEIAERLSAVVAAADIAALERAAGTRQAEASHAASMQAIEGLRAQLDRVSHAVENVFWRRWLRRLRGAVR